MRAALFIALALIALVGCAQVDPSGLTSDQKQQLEDEVKKLLRDPDSAKFEWENINDPDPSSAHMVQYCFKVNAKNGFGGYTGFKRVYSMFYRNDGNPLEYIAIGGIENEFTAFVGKLCSEIDDKNKVPVHDQRITDDQARAGCSILDGKLFCASPGTGMCWEKGHNPWKGEHPARAIDVGTDPASPDHNRMDRCG